MLLRIVLTSALYPVTSVSLVQIHKPLEENETTHINNYILLYLVLDNTQCTQNSIVWSIF